MNKYYFIKLYQLEKSVGKIIKKKKEGGSTEKVELIFVAFFKKNMFYKSTAQKNCKHFDVVIKIYCEFCDSSSIIYPNAKNMRVGNI